MKPNESRTSLISQCIEHKGCKLPNGYGKRGKNGKTWLAHRLAWVEKFGPIPDGLCVCHKCDNRLCVNPEHLFLGTRHDNMRDMLRKGRNRWVFSPKRKAPPARVAHESASARIDWATADKIRSLKGLVGQKEAARQFGVSPATVWRIYTGASWKPEWRPKTD